MMSSQSKRVLVWEMKASKVKYVCEMVELSQFATGIFQKKIA